MAKQKVGLHRQVSEIFDGVPIPKKGSPNEPAKTPVSNRLDFLHPTSRESTSSADTKNLRHPQGCHSASGQPSARPKQSKITIVIKAFKRIRQHIFHPRTAWLKR